MPTKIPIDWKTLIYRGVESDELDYKAAQNWRELNRRGKSKFVRHCLAMANTKGGYIIVGVGEDDTGKPCLYTGMTDREAKSFDPTDVGHFINRYADPAIDFDIERPIVEGKTYVVFVIRRFSTLPHVCGFGCESELQQGAFYIRTADASSRVAYRASEIHLIIQRALRNQRESLGRMIRGVLYEGQNGSESSAVSYFSEERENSRKFVANRDSRFNINNQSLFEVSAELDSYNQDEFALSEIRRAVTFSACTFSGTPFLFIGDMDETFFTNIALRSYSSTSEQFWQAFQSGLFHYIRPIKTDNGADYREIIQFVAEAIHFLCEYYSELGLADEMLTLRFRMHNVEGVMLAGLEPFIRGRNETQKYESHIPKIKVKIKRTVADLASAPVQHSIKVVKEICERFNFPSNSHEYLEETITAFLGKRC